MIQYFMTCERKWFGRARERWLLFDNTDTDTDAVFVRIQGKRYTSSVSCQTLWVGKLIVTHNVSIWVIRWILYQVKLKHKIYLINVESVKNSISISTLNKPAFYFHFAFALLLLYLTEFFVDFEAGCSLLFEILCAVLVSIRIDL